jgi:hypothetical protein
MQKKCFFCFCFQPWCIQTVYNRKRCCDKTKYIFLEKSNWKKPLTWKIVWHQKLASTHMRMKLDLEIIPYLVSNGAKKVWLSFVSSTFSHFVNFIFFRVRTTPYWPSQVGKPVRDNLWSFAPHKRSSLFLNLICKSYFPVTVLFLKQTTLSHKQMSQLL